MQQVFRYLHPVLVSKLLRVCKLPILHPVIDNSVTISNPELILLSDQVYFTSVVLVYYPDCSDFRCTRMLLPLIVHRCYTLS